MRKWISAWLGCVALAIFTVACAQSDAGITTKVKAKMTSDDMVKAYQIDVTTQNKVVTLMGQVDSRAAKDRAVEIARSTEGVANVVDNLTVREAAAAPGGYERGTEPGGAPTMGGSVNDASITATVKTKLLADSLLGGLKIDVDTSNGVVTLRGDVKNQAAKAAAIRIARATDGVLRVEDKIVIRP